MKNHIVLLCQNEIINSSLNFIYPIQDPNIAQSVYHNIGERKTIIENGSRLCFL